MCTFEKGNMWDAWTVSDQFIFTGNAIIKANGALVMGRGIARQVRDRFPNIDRAIGQRIAEMTQPYGLALGNKVCVFQVKRHWQDDADFNLICLAIDMLLVESTDKPHLRYDLNFPGIGNGRRADLFDEIKEELSVLPNNVHIWTFK